MTIKVIDFYRKKEKGENPFISTLVDPTYCILMRKNNVTKEYILNLKGEFPYISYSDLECFDEAFYKDFNIITDFILGDYKEILREKWGFSKEEYASITFELYKALVNNHSFYGWFKRKLLILLGFLKFYSGRN